VDCVYSVAGSKSAFFSFKFWCMCFDDKKGFPKVLEQGAGGV